MKKFPINNTDLCRAYIKQKGICLFEDLAPFLEKYTKHFDKNDKTNAKQEEGDEVRCIQGEKFNINEDHDFKEWERYDIL